MSTTKIPLLIDAHFHARDLKQTHKGTFETETKAALLGGVGTVLAMPNTDPALITRSAVVKARHLAEGKLYCDLGFYLGTDGSNLSEFEYFRTPKYGHDFVNGLKVYLDPTTGNLEIKDLKLLEPVFKYWASDKPILVHAEDLEKLERALSLAGKYERHIHICHVNTADQVRIIWKARDERKAETTCEVCPHHLAFTEPDRSWLGPYGIMKPPLGTEKDREALWEGLTMGIISIIATDHAPHSQEEKASENPPFGVIAEPLFPVLYSLFRQRKLSWGFLVQKMHDIPMEIFDLQSDSDSYMEVDLEEEYVVTRAMIHSKAGRSPYENMEVRGRIKRVILHGTEVARNGEVIARNGKLI